MSKRVKQQHYVWRYYLAAWESKGSLHALRGGKIFPTSARGIAKESAFYRLRELTLSDLELVEKVAIECSNPQFRDMHREQLAHFYVIPHLVKLARSLPIGNSQREEIDAVLQNTEEEFQNGIEEIGKPFLDALRSGDTSFMADDCAAANFLYFVVCQYFRTKKRAREMISQIAESRFSDAKESMERAWPVLRNIFSTNVAGALYARRSEWRLILLDNPHDETFICGDQPVINLPFARDATSVPTDLELYYPITPHLAVIYTNKMDRFSGERVIMNLQEVGSYNRAIASSRLEFLVADTRAALLPYI